MIRLYEGDIQPHDFFFFVSREFNLKSSVDYYIHNYAIMYSIRKKLNVVTKGFEPKYHEELLDLPYYCFPAFPLNTPSYVFHTYNSIDTLRNTPEEPKNKRRNVPSYGTYQKIIPLSTSFRTYIISKEELKPPRVIRLGKKLAPCILNIKELKIKDVILNPEKAVKFSVPINLLDFSINNRVKEASIYYMSPSPIVTDVIAKMPYIIAHDTDTKRMTLIPIPKKFMESKEFHGR